MDANRNDHSNIQMGCVYYLLVFAAISGRKPLGYIVLSYCFAVIQGKRWFGNNVKCGILAFEVDEKNKQKYAGLWRLLMLFLLYLFLYLLVVIIFCSEVLQAWNVILSWRIQMRTWTFYWKKPSHFCRKHKAHMINCIICNEILSHHIRIIEW